MKLLIKIGTALISRNNRIDYTWLQKKVDEISALYREGVRPVIVSSGAVAAGMEIRSLRNRPSDILSLQMLSGIGQVHLSKYFKDLFKEKYIFTAQMLLTHHNFDDAVEVDTITGIINAYCDEGIIPIINENDMVNKEELDSEGTFTDNDILAAFVASAVKVDKAVILTNVDGLHEGNPHAAGGDKDGKPALIRKVDKIDGTIHSMVSEEKSDMGQGGMLSKIRAAEMITRAGIETVVANGNYSLIDILEERVPSTLFTAG